MPDQHEPTVQNLERNPSKTQTQAKPAASILNKTSGSPVKASIANENQMKRSNNVNVNTSAATNTTNPINQPETTAPTRPAVNPTQIPNTGASSSVKYGSVSFTVPDQTEKSHRGSISARPSAIHINTLGQAPTMVQPQGLMTPQQPSDTGSKIKSTSTVISPQTGSSSTTTTDPKLSNPANVQRQYSISNTIASRNPSISSTYSGSANSSRQNSNTGEFIQFTANNFPSYHQYPQENVPANGLKSPELINRKNSTSPTSLDQHRVPSPADSQKLDDPQQSQPIAIPKKIKEKPTKAVIGTPTTTVPFYEFFQKQDDNKIHILIGATGSVATIKVPLIIDKICKLFGSSKVSIQLVVTKAAEHFLKGLKINSDVKIWRDDEEWFGYKKMGDPVLHTELRRWADIMLISPLSANTLAKISNGICDNLLTAIIRSWNPASPILVAPAMNTFMYTHPVTSKHLTSLQEDCPWIEILKPVEKVLVCGDIGMGGMREWSDIVEILAKKLKEIQKARELESRLAEGTSNGKDDDNKGKGSDTNEDEDGDDDDDDDDDDDNDDNDDDDDDDDDDEDDEDDDDEDEDDDEDDYGDNNAVIDDQQNNHNSNHNSIQRTDVKNPPLESLKLST
ncbi:hypothetical protein BN7_6302 [Wickerhamomyces ciferrii]|uniref:Flavoprotein domain-containing protein n=1 Tax=Wickerhamomyces ciferrii (strain ATCC 14091 / BCRC 22168 / CBS 111 / JCM 3599 / NBRC 0793 / NRRL Y-1031 F-60-10) TaxID=1206466 RepID=K0KN66_WICCF|nr:uncharacterized protein BN7_6302 [Wickerhamomyces ciferrii]CCH46705.1 hypothetical protein BN7_6302 [Wickerhamomyces ciferrii]